MADFKVKVVADTDDAKKKISDVDELVTKTTKDRQLRIEIPNYSQLHKNLTDFKKDVSDAANTIKDFYKVTSKLPIGPVNDIKEMASQLKNVAQVADQTRRNIGDAGDVIQSTLNNAGRAAESLVSRLTRIAFSLYVINEASQAVQQAFGGLFNDTIGREIQLRETILKTQTTLASTNKVYKGNKEITDPYEKIVSLTGAVVKNIDSIRERSIALAGVTSNDVIEVFGITASLVGQIGGGLKEAEDLAVNFAAALGTFGIPLYQARQEIGSILRGDITTDSILAKSLGITNQDIAKAKTQVGGVTKFLEDRLSAAVAGQRIAAEGFRGVVSNIKDISELVQQAFGRGLLDPLIDGLTKVFNYLFGIRKQLLGVAELAGKTVGSVLSTGLGMTFGASGVSRGTEEKGQQFLQATQSAVKSIGADLTAAFKTVYLQLATLLERIQTSVLVIGKGFAALAAGLLSLKLEQLKAAIGAIESISPALLVAANALAGFLALWGNFMKMPIVQEISQINAGMRILEASGVSPFIRNAFILQGVLANWGRVSQFVINQFNALRAVIGGLISWIGGLGVAVGQLGSQMLAAWVPQGRALQALKGELTQIATQLGVVGNAAQVAGQKIGSLGGQAKGASQGIVGLVVNFVRFNALLFLFNAGLSLIIERFSAYKEQLDKQASERRAEEALRRLATTYKDVGESSSAAEKRAKEFDQTLVSTQYEEARKRIEEIRKELDGLKRDQQIGINSWEEFGRVLNNVFVDSLNPFSDSVNEERRQIGKLIAEEARLRAIQRKIDAQEDKDTQEENIRLEEQKRKDLEKDIAAFRRQEQSKLFDAAQDAARREIDLIKLEGDLRIDQIDTYNAKLYKGQEGTSATALGALNEYIKTKKKGEIDIEARRRTLILEMQSLEKTIADYRFETEQKIFEMRRRAGLNEVSTARAAGQAARQAATPGGGSATGSTAPALQGIDDLNANRSSAQLAQRLRQAATTQQRMAVIEAAMTNARTAQAFRKIGESAFPLIEIEQFLDRINEAKEELKELRQTSAESFNPELISMSAKYLGLAREKLRELNQISQGVVANQLLSESEKTRILEDLNAKFIAYKERLKDVVRREEELLDIEIRRKEVRESLSRIRDLGESAVDSRRRAELTLQGLPQYEIDAQLEVERRQRNNVRLGISDEPTFNIERDAIVNNSLVTAAASLAVEAKRNSDQIQDNIADMLLQARLEFQGKSPERVNQELARSQTIRKYERQGLANSPALQQELTLIDDQAAASLAVNNPLTKLFGEWKRQINDTKELFKSLTQTVQSELSTAMSSAVAGAVQGTTTIREAFLNMLQNIAKAYLDMASQMITKALVMQAFNIFRPGNPFAPKVGFPSAMNWNVDQFIPGFIPKAKGGSVNSKQPYLVGERGPELFIPDKTGTIIPNNALGGNASNVVVNVDASGSKVQGDNERASALGRAVASAVQQELIRQKRPGGLLA